MVPIFTYRDERKLFAVIGTVIVAALIALVQVEYAREGRTSPLSTTVSSLGVFLELAVSVTGEGLRRAFDGVVHTPRFYDENVRLRAENERLARDNTVMQERLARVPDALAFVEAQAEYPSGVAATVVGYDPENALRVVTIDKGSFAHVRRDDGVVSAQGVVGRVIDVGPLSSTVLLVTDVTSKLPAVVQRGRWWGIANGTMSRIKLQYVSQDARLKVGDRVVTGEGRSFHAGILIGRIKKLERQAAGALDQSALIEPAVPFGRLHNVLVLPK